MVDATVRRQLAAVGPDRRRRPRVGDVPAQRPAPAARPVADGRGRLHRVRAPHRARLRRLGLPGARLGQAPGLHGRRLGGVRVWSGLAPGGRGAALGLTGVAVGWLVGAWGGADIGAGNVGEAVVATVVPAAAFGVRFGLAPEPDARKRRRIDQRPGPGSSSRRRWRSSPSAWWARWSARSTSRSTTGTARSPSGWTTTTPSSPARTSSTPPTGRTSSPAGSSTSPSPCWSSASSSACSTGRRTSQPFEPRSQPGRPHPGRAVRPVVRGVRLHPGTIMNNIWWVIVVTSLATALGLAVAVARRPGQGREHGQVLDLPTDGHLLHRRRDHLALHVPGPRSLAEPDRA